MSFTETDLDELLEEGISVLVNGITMTGLFHNPYKLVDQPSGEVSSSAPTLLIKTSLAVDVAYETPVTIDGIDYEVAETQPEDTGFTRLILTKAE